VQARAPDGKDEEVEQKPEFLTKNALVYVRVKHKRDIA
jgi:hypothetical protein